MQENFSRSPRLYLQRCVCVCDRRGFHHRTWPRIDGGTCIPSCAYGRRTPHQPSPTHTDLVSSRMSEPRKKRSLARAVRRFRCSQACRARCHHMAGLIDGRAGLVTKQEQYPSYLGSEEPSRSARWSSAAAIPPRPTRADAAPWPPVCGWTCEVRARVDPFGSPDHASIQRQAAIIMNNYVSDELLAMVRG